MTPPTATLSPAPAPVTSRSSASGDSARSRELSAWSGGDIVLLVVGGEGTSVLCVL